MSIVYCLCPCWKIEPQAVEVESFLGYIDLVAEESSGTNCIELSYIDNKVWQGLFNVGLVIINGGDAHKL